jgi:Ca2+-binding RTX toxin-like protein
VQASASDNVGVTKVEFYVDGTLQGSDPSSPYSLSLDTSALANGSHSLVAKAYDAAGNIANSSAISINVQNAVAPTTGIFFNAATGVLTIHGGGYRDTAAIQPFTLNGVATAHVTLTSRNAAGAVVLSQVVDIALSQIQTINFYGYAGNDTFTNKTSVACNAWGGDGSDILRGGSGVDHLYGEAGGDSIYGGDGNDYLDGGLGVDYLYGQGGVDVLIAGDTGYNYLAQDGS